MFEEKSVMVLLKAFTFLGFQVKADLPSDALQKQYPQIKGFHYVSSLTGYVSTVRF